MRRTVAASFGQNSHASTLSSSNALGKAGATSIGFNASVANTGLSQRNNSTSNGFTIPQNEAVSGTSHWKSTYTGVVESTVGQPVTKM